MSTRRELLLGAAGLVMAGRASAQQRTYRMAYLTGGALKGHEPYRKALFGRLEELGGDRGATAPLSRS